MDLPLQSEVTVASHEPAVTSFSVEAAAPAARRIYRASLVPAAYSAGTFSFLIICGLLFGRPVAGSTLVVVVAGFALISLLLALLISSSARLIVSPEGLEYAALGNRLRVPWEGVVGVGEATFGGGKVEVLALRQHALKVSKGWSLGLAALPVAKGVTLAAGHAGAAPAGQLDGYVILIGYFERAWRKGMLAAEVKRYAPQAFDTLSS